MDPRQPEAGWRPDVNQLLSGALIVLLLISATLNVALATALQERKRGVAVGLDPGTELSPLAGVTPEGRDLVIDYSSDSRPTVLYYFSPACAWCERNWPNVRALTTATSDRFRWIGVSAATTEDLAAFTAARRLDLEVITALAPELISEYRLTGTPNTLVVGSDGRLVKGWVGAFQGELAGEIEAFFGTELPGLAPSEASTDDVGYGDPRG